MKIHRDQNQNQLQVSQYGDGYVEIGAQRHTTGINIVGQEVFTHPRPMEPSSLSYSDLIPLLEPRPEVVLIGTGPTLCFPDMRLVKNIQELGIGCDVMDSGAACRTYNILTSEGRSIAAFLILP